MENTKQIESFSAEDTHALGKKLGENAKPGDVYTLLGDLGVGKTVLTQGIADGLGIKEAICSPTFTIVNEYNSENINLYHFDVYRLEDVDEFYAIGGDEYFSKGICIIEWPEIADDITSDKLTYSSKKIEEIISELKTLFQPAFKLGDGLQLVDGILSVSYPDGDNIKYGTEGEVAINDR